MKVRELIKILEDQNPEMVVVIQADDEGNSYNSLDYWRTGLFNEDDSEVGPLELTEKLINQGFTEEDMIEDGKPAIILG